MGDVVLFPVLTVKAIKARPWDASINLPLPVDPSLELIEKATEDLLQYLGLVTTAMAHARNHDVRQEIARVCGRLTELSLMRRSAWFASMDALSRRLDYDRHDGVP